MTSSQADAQGLTIAMVGHCVADEVMLKQFVKRHAPQAHFVRVADERALESVLSSPALLLVNRVLDGDFAEDSGLRVVERAAGGTGVAMLISNLSEAQQASVQSGGIAGFGKSQLGDPGSVERLREAIHQASANAHNTGHDA